ncbi:MAG: hypothetical protein KGL39_50240, partial [Patescibacteria group bacterium]|nr:hypothetical protein [Patescibacteria group bacterium]
GNVYPIRGGRGLKYGHMQVLIAIARAREAWQGDSGLLLVIDKEGAPVGVNSYGMHALEELQPIAFVEGLEEMTLAMRSL